jgi:vacuolar-type H+-ATPase subunit C/Vma6
MVNATLFNLTMVNGTNSSLLNTTSSKLAFLAPLANPVFLSFALPMIFVAVIFIFIVKHATPVSHFLYSNARITARTNYMVTGELLNSLAEAKSLRELRSLLKDTAYADELEKSSEDLREFHARLERAQVDSVRELVDLSPEKSQPLFDAYLMFYESKILKIIYRARFMGVQVDESLVYPIGRVDETLLQHLLETSTVADIGVVMLSTKYSEIFNKQYQTLEEFEVAMDQFVLNNFVEIVQKTKMYDGKYIIDMLNKKIDISNILAILKFRIRGIEKQKQKSLLIYNSTEVCSKFDLLINAASLEDFTEALKGMVFHEPMAKALEKYRKDHALSHFENALYRFFKAFISGNDLNHTLGPYPLFSYLIKRELELRNLFIISRGIDAGFPVAKIKEMIV